MISVEKGYSLGSGQEFKGRTKKEGRAFHKAKDKNKSRVENGNRECEVLS